MTIQTLDTDEATTRPYAHGLVARGALIFVSGQTPLHDDGTLDESIEAQVAVVLAKIQNVLRRAGASLDDVAHCGVYVADLADLPRLDSAYERAFPVKRPTRTTVGVNLPGYGVEIDCIAVLAPPDGAALP